MKREFDKEMGCHFSVPETPTEAVEQLATLFNVDMWYAKGAEWKTEEDMWKYLNAHFKICKNQIKRIEEEKLSVVVMDESEHAIKLNSVELQDKFGELMHAIKKHKSSKEYQKSVSEKKTDTTCESKDSRVQGTKSRRLTDNSNSSERSER